MPTIWHEGKIVGETTSGGYGHRVDASIAIGMIKTDLARAGQKVHIEIFGEMKNAVVNPMGPVWDNNNLAMRS